MANDTDVDSGIRAHLQTYEGLIALLKWGAVAVAVIVAGVIWRIAR